MAGYVGNVPVPQSVREDQSFTATAGQTTFNTLGYTDGTRIKVTLNGVLLEGGGVDYTATNGSDIVLTSAAAADDILRFETFNEFTLVGQELTTPTINGGTLKSDVTLKNDTEQDTDGGRASKIIFKGEQSGGEISTLAEIQASHDGTADDEKGDLIFRTNDGSDSASPTERLRISSDSTFTFTSDDAGAGIGPHQVYYRNSSSPADNDLLTEIDHRGRNDNSQDVDYATVNIFAEDVSDGTEDGKYLLQTIKAGAVVSRMDVNSTETVFNDDSKDIDFRVESDGNANMLFVDAANDRVGIGTNSPIADFSIVDPTTSSGMEFQPEVSTDTNRLTNYDRGDSSYKNFILDALSHEFRISGTNKFAIQNDGRFKAGETSYAQFTGAIHSSETRYYKLINYTSGYMLDAVVFMQANRNGGFNQSAGFRNYNCAVGGYSNALYGPITATGDSGESGNMTLHAGSDEAIYLKLTPNTYGGTVNGVIIGRIRTWDYDGTYVTSAP